MLDVISLNRILLDDINKRYEMFEEKISIEENFESNFDFNSMAQDYMEFARKYHEQYLIKGKRCDLDNAVDNYIDAIKRVVAYCEKNGAAPAYVLSSSIEIGFAEYSFGFSKILAFYKTEKALPLYNVFT